MLFALSQNLKLGHVASLEIIWALSLCVLVGFSLSSFDHFCFSLWVADRCLLGATAVLRIMLFKAVVAAYTAHPVQFPD